MKPDNPRWHQQIAFRDALRCSRSTVFWISCEAYRLF
jgi:hypothetical protein